MIWLEVYRAVFWPSISFLLIVAVFYSNMAVIRCALVMMGGEWATGYWQAHLRPAEWHGQPVELLAFIYFVSAAIVTIRTSGKSCSILGGVFCAGFIFSIINMCFEYDAARDWQYWGANLAISWLALLVVIGGSTGETGKRFVSDLWRRFIDLVDATYPRRLAR